MSERAGPSTASAPKDISTRSNLVIFVSRLSGIDNHLSVLQTEHWAHAEPPAPSVSKLTENSPSHPSLIDEIARLIYSIENRVEFLNARL